MKWEISKAIHKESFFCASDNFPLLIDLDFGNFEENLLKMMIPLSFFLSLTTTESQYKMERRLFLDVVVRKGSAILKLLSGEDKSLLIWRNTFLVLDFGLDIFNGVSWFDIQCNGFSSESFDENLHSTSKSKDKMKSRFLLDVVVGESSAVLKLLSGKNESLLIWRNAFFILDLGFDILNRISWFDIKCNSFASESFDKYLHATSESQNKMEGRLFLDVVVW